MNDDRVWMNEDRKLAGICSEILTAPDGGFLLIAHFEDTVAALEAALRERSIAYHVYSPFDRLALCAEGGTGSSRVVWLALARDIHIPPGSERVAGALPLAVMVAEHYPLRPVDDAVVEAVNTLPCAGQINFYCSLDDGLMLQVGGQKMAGLLQQLGLKDDEHITHPAITAAIRRAQERIGEKVPEEVRTRSAVEWCRYNLPAG